MAFKGTSNLKISQQCQFQLHFKPKFVVLSVLKHYFLTIVNTLNQKNDEEDLHQISCISP